MPSNQDNFTKANLPSTQAWKFAGLVQSRLTHPVDEKVIAIPASPTPGSQDWNGGVYTFVAPGGEHVRVGRVRNGVDRGGETWVDLSRDGGKNWQRITEITKEDENAGGKQIASVERPYLYGRMVKGELWIVLGTCAAERGTKCWDIHEREAPLAQLERLKTAPVRVALAGNAGYAYKDGVPILAPNAQGIYLGATRHHIGGAPAAAVNADTVLCKLDETTGRYEIIDDVILPRGARGAIDKTCNRLSCELAFPDGTRFWGCDVRNVEEPNAALKNPLKPGDTRQWTLGDFDEITSFAIATWPEGTALPEVTSIDAILGRSSHPNYPTLRYLGIAPLVFTAVHDDEPVVLLTCERAAATGAKSTFQQAISRKELMEAIDGKGPALLVGQDPDNVILSQRICR